MICSVNFYHIDVNLPFYAVKVLSRCVKDYVNGLTFILNCMIIGRIMKHLYLVLVMLVLLPGLRGQETGHTIKKDPDIASPAATIDQLSWIAGHWKGEAFGGVTEEIWTPPLGSSMMGAFKLSHGDKIAFYELCIIREVDTTVLLQLRHFNEDLKGWEEKNETVDFPLVKLGKDIVYFDQFTFQRINNNEMHLYVVINNNDDEGPQEVKFVYNRIK